METLFRIEVLPENKVQGLLNYALYKKHMYKFGKTEKRSF